MGCARHSAAFVRLLGSCHKLVRHSWSAGQLLTWGPALAASWQSCRCLVILQLEEKVESSSECEDMVHRLQVAVGEADGPLTYLGW